MQSQEFQPSVHPEIWSRFPDYRALSVIITRFAPDSPLVPLPIVPAPWCDEHIEAWHAAFRSFGTNPRRMPPSLDSLLRRFRKEGTLPSIHPLVDYYNALSIRSGAPFGGEDISAYEGSPRLVIADGSEPFDSMRDGQPVVELAEPGEVIWRDDRGVTCRRWNWRQGRRTAITPGSRDLWFVIDRLPPMGMDDLQSAGKTLAEALLHVSPGSNATIHLLAPDS